MDPSVIAIVSASIVVVVFAIIARAIGKRRESAAWRRRREAIRTQTGFVQVQQHERERLAARIIATSSTQSIVGFEVLRQIEAVFADGYRSQPLAVEALKARAAQQGANAVINLASERVPNGKCAARGDAVIVRPIDAPQGRAVDGGANAADAEEP